MVPAFEKSCKAMFEQVKGMAEHATAHSPLTHALRVCILIPCELLLFFFSFIDNFSSFMLSRIIILGVPLNLFEKKSGDW